MATSGLLDFGLAKLGEGPSADSPHHADITTLGIVMGTPRYMSPDRRAGSSSMRAATCGASAS